MPNPAHGTPDWGLTAGTVTTYQLTDLAELAARLGSILTYDRRGEVLFLDYFEHGLGRWTTTGAGTGNTAYLSGTNARTGAFTLCLVAGSTGTAFARADHVGPRPPANPFGAEFSFTLDDFTANWEVSLIYDDGTTRWVLDARYVHTPPSKLELWTPSGYVTVALIDQQDEDPKTFHTMKLVGDPTTSLYKRLLFNHLSLDISDQTIPTLVSSRPHTLEVRIRHQGTVGIVTPGYVDDVILTQNEPP